MSNKPLNLPVSVLDSPHWRVNFRPKEYDEELIPSLGKCFEIIEKTKLSLRGWDYPHLSNRRSEQSQGKNWVASWSDFMGNLEYWRFYQSGQFIHLFSVREAIELELKEQMESRMKLHFRYMNDFDWDNVCGFISIPNFIYTITEIFEFAARLCQAEVYNDSVNINIEINDIKNFVLFYDPYKRSWHSIYISNEENLIRTLNYNCTELIADSAEIALNTIVWFFERFGWFSSSKEILQNDQENFLKRRI